MTSTSNLIINPDASTGTMSGWTYSSGTGTNSSTGWAACTGLPYNGTYSFCTSATNTTSMSQALSLLIDYKYSISVWINTQGYMADYMTLSIGGNTLISLTGESSNGYIKYSYNYTAVSTGETLKISGYSGGVALNLGYVSVDGIANLVINPGAETGSTSGWVNPNSFTYAVTSWQEGLVPHTGSYFFYLGGSFYQGFSLIVGAEYSFSFWMMHVYDPYAEGPSSLQVSIGSTSLFILTIPITTTSTYKLYSTSFVSTSTYENLEFYTPNGGLAIDDVQIYLLSLPPTSIPTYAPTAPTIIPTSIPSLIPTSIPVSEPTTIPTIAPTLSPYNINLADLTIYQGFNITGTNIGSISGFSVSGAGDINGDGYDDIIIGAPAIDNFSINGINSTVYVIYGRISMPSTIDLVNISSFGFSIYNTVNSQSGYSVSSAGDMNKDGYDDIVIGALSVNCIKSSCNGEVYVVYGGNSIPNSINLSNLGNRGFYIPGANGISIGGSVSGTGDINKDGYDDIIIGAPGVNSITGECYIIYGNMTFPTIINIANLGSSGFKVVGANINSEFGASVSGAGDINKDGYDDIVIGAPLTNSAMGTVYVLFGRASFTSEINIANLGVQGFNITNAPVGSWSGYSVSGAGDVNGDGYDDIVIGAIETDRVDDNTVGSGTTYVIYGNASFPNSINLMNLGTQGFNITGIANSQSGYSVSSAGDMNKDGYDDIVIGANWINNEAGESYVIYGNVTLPNTINLINIGSYGFYIYGAPYGSASGSSVSTVGDINKDGYDDIIIGAPYANDDAGISYVIYGAASGFVTSVPTPTPTISLTPTVESTVKPSTLPTIFPTAIPSLIPTSIPTSEPTTIPTIAPTLSPYNINLADLNIYQGFNISGNNYAGFSVSEAGDVNGDDYDDFIIGDPYANNNAGVVYVIYGSAFPTNINLTNISLSQGFRIIDAPYRSQSGFAVSGAGDVNGDGYDDVVIGAPYGLYGGDDDEYDFGYVFVIYGNSSTVNINLTSLTKSQGFLITGVIGASLGGSVSGAGDVNNDGYDDIIIADYGSSANYNYGAPVCSYIIYGGESLSNIISPITSEQGVKIQNNLGDCHNQYVSGIGDINGDGLDDIILGIPCPSNNNEGVTVIIYGSTSLPPSIGLNYGSTSLPRYELTPTTCGFTIIGYDIGYSVADAGDINNDGYDDMIIAGSPYNYVIYGAKDLGTTTIYLASLGAKQGFHIAAGYPVVNGAGDVNDDGYDDIMVMYNTACYIIFGNKTEYLTNISFTNFSTSQGFPIGFGGYSGSPYSRTFISGAGDINNDGYDDMVFAPFISVSTPNYVVYGAANGFITQSPTSVPTVEPTLAPTTSPITLPTLSPSVTPTALPTSLPTSEPSVVFTSSPTIVPTTVSTAAPTVVLTSIPSSSPTAYVTDTPTSLPLTQPTQAPTSTTHSPSSEPTTRPNIIELSSFSDGPTSYGFGIYGEIENSQLGFSVSGGVLLPKNNSQAIVGAPYYNSSDYTGYTLISSNKENAVNNFDIINSINFGYSVAYIGNFNNNSDGFNCFIVGAPSTNNNTGSAYIYSNNQLILSIMGINPYNATSIGDQTGFSVSGIGDFNGDNVPDVAVGAPYANQGYGASYVIFGSKAYNYTSPSILLLASLTSSEGIVLYGQSSKGNSSYSDNSVPTTCSGWSLSGGDLNNDGLSDIVVGEPLYKNNQGRICIAFGSKSPININLTTSANVNCKLVGTATDSQYSYVGSLYGYSVSVGDVNHDSSNDIMITAPEASTVSSSGEIIQSTGKIQIIYGTGSNALKKLTAEDSPEGFYIYGGVVDSFTGWSASIVNDVNGDNINDIVIGAPGFSNSSIGYVYVIYGLEGSTREILTLSTSLSTNTGFVCVGATEGDGTGFSVNGVGDINGDSIADIIIGAPYSSYHTEVNAGNVYVVYGFQQLASQNDNLIKAIKHIQAFNFNPLIASIPTSIPTFSTKNLLTNGNAENKNMEPWEPDKISKPYKVLGSWESKKLNPHSGSYSFVLDGNILNNVPIKIAAITTITAFMIQSVSLEKGADYTISLWAARSASSSSYLYLTLDGIKCPNDIPIISQNKIYMKITPQSPMQYYLTTFTCTAVVDGARLFTIQGYVNSGNNQLYLDDISVIQQSTSSKTSYSSIYKEETDITSFIKKGVTKSAISDDASIYIINGGKHYITSSGNYIIDSSLNSTIIAENTYDIVYTFIPQPYSYTKLTYFNLSSDIIDLSEYTGIYNIDQLEMAIGQIGERSDTVNYYSYYVYYSYYGDDEQANTTIINLQNNQTIELYNINPEELSASNFIFAMSPEPTFAPTVEAENSSSSSMSIVEIAGIAVGGAAALLMGATGVYGLYAYSHRLWPFAGESLASKAVDVGSNIGNDVL